MKAPTSASAPLRILVILMLVSSVFIIAVLFRLTKIVTPNGNIQTIVIDNGNRGELTINIKRTNDKETVSSSNITSSHKDDISLTSPPSAPDTFPFMDVGKSWKDPFCDEFLSNKFSVKMTPCDPNSDRVLCYGSPYDDKMGSCFIKNLAMDPQKFHSIMRTNRDSVQESNSLWLLRDASNTNPCNHKVFDPMEKYMVGGDYVKCLAKTSILSVPKGNCQKWINGTTFIFMGFDSHIYFKYLSWFSLHNGIINFESHSGRKPSLIIRIPQTKDKFTHADYEQKLFSETTLMSLGDFSDSNKGVTCFEEVIITPWAYSTSAFRCKMADAVYRLRNRCFNCNSRGLPGTRYLSFRRRALSACSIEEIYPDPAVNKKSSPKKIVLEVRKPYMRHSQDVLSTFHRTFVNPKELLDQLKKDFPNATIESMIGEEMSLCDQIKMVHDADVLMGVHGAGMVHVWWLQDHALLFELVPQSQMANPSFKMLSSLTGKRYYEYTRLKGSEMQVIVDAHDVVQELKKRY